AFDRIAAFGGNDSMQDGAGNEAEGEPVCLLIGAGDDGGTELLMLVVEGGTEAALGGGELILGCGQKVQREVTFVVRLNGCDRMAVFLREHGHAGAAHTRARCSVHDGASDAIERGGRGSGGGGR